MTMQSAKPVSLGAVLLERAAAILRMKALRLDLGWLREFDLPELNEACGRMEEELPGERPLWENIQRELIQNPAFARYLARFLPLLPEDAPTEPPKPVYPAGRYGQPTIQVAPSRRSEMMCRLDGFVEACQGNGKDPAGYNLQDLVGILEMDELDGAGRLVYLENFAPMALTHEQKGLAINTVALHGRLTADPELKRTPNDIPVVNFSLAVNSGSGDKQTVAYIDCVGWRKTAEFICKYFSKGEQMNLTGALRTRSYEDKNGTKRKVKDGQGDWESRGFYQHD